MPPHNPHNPHLSDKMAGNCQKYTRSITRNLITITNPLPPSRNLAHTAANHSPRHTDSRQHADSPTACGKRREMALWWLGGVAGMCGMGGRISIDHAIAVVNQNIASLRTYRDGLAALNEIQMPTAAILNEIAQLRASEAIFEQHIESARNALAELTIQAPEYTSDNSVWEV